MPRRGHWNNTLVEVLDETIGGGYLVRVDGLHGLLLLSKDKVKLEPRPKPPPRGGELCWLGYPIVCSEDNCWGCPYYNELHGIKEV